MYAVIKTGGKQYKVAAGEKLKIENMNRKGKIDCVIHRKWDDKLKEDIYII